MSIGPYKSPLMAFGSHEIYNENIGAAYREIQRLEIEHAQLLTALQNIFDADGMADTLLAIAVAKALLATGIGKRMIDKPQGNA